MNDVLYKLLERFHNLEEQINAHLGILLAEPDMAIRIVLMNAEQLYAGKRTDGSDIEPYYTPWTIEEKQYKDQPYDRVTLRDKGDFYEGLRVNISYGRIDIYGTDSKTKELEQKYDDGPDATILGLTDENIDKVRMYLLPELQSFTRNYLTSVK